MSGVIGAGADIHKAARAVDLSTGPAHTYAKPDGASFAVDVEAGRTVTLGPAAVTLLAGLGKDRVTRDAVAEGGDSRVALAFDEVRRDALQGRLGARVAGRMELGGVQFTPHASVFVLRELDGARSRLEASLQGAGFSLASSSPGKTAVRFDAGLDAAVGPRGRLSFGYRYEGAGEADSHAVSLTGAIAW